jgi:8-oxo-dGTP diphosphatase
MTIVRFYDPDFVPAGRLTYSVISARFIGNWIFVRHCDRSTWEIAGGHIENGESPDEAAFRELKEETGAREFDLECVATYSVEQDGIKGFGRLFFAEVKLLGEVPDVSEIAEIMLSGQLPQNLTYPYIQPLLFGKIIDYLEGKGKL